MKIGLTVWLLLQLSGQSGGPDEMVPAQVLGAYADKASCENNARAMRAQSDEEELFWECHILPPSGLQDLAIWVAPGGE
jgi:hypothetical protein